VLLRPSIIVIYDELEADHPAQWSWLLHSPDKISCDSAHNRLTVADPTARSQVDFFAPLALNFDVHDRFAPPAANWRDKTSGGKTIQYPNQWHAAASPASKIEKMRYLAVMQITGSDDTSVLNSPQVSGNDAVQVGPWSIAAVLNPAQPAALEIRSLDEKAALAVNKASIGLASRRYQATRSDSSLLVELQPGGDTVRESADVSPPQ
jgi:hypothetical protein